MNVNLQPTLVGKNISLRPLKQSDFLALYEAASDPEVWAMHPDSCRYKKEIFEKRFFSGAITSGSALAVLDSESGEIIGSSRFYDCNSDKKEIAIGFTFLACAYWGNGTTNEMKELMLKHVSAFAKTVWFHVGEANFRSCKAVEKLGAIVSHKEDRELEGRPFVQVFYKLDISG